MSAPIEPLLVLSYFVFGATFVCWRAGTGDRISDGTMVLILLLWPAWFVAWLAYRYGWRQR